MGIETTTPLVWVPSAATGVSVTPSATAWANSSWVELIASTANPIQIEQIAIDHGTSFNEFEIDMGKGAAGSETVVGTIRGATSTATSLRGNWTQVFEVVIDNIPASTRVATRLRKDGTDTTVWQLALGYHNQITSTNVTVKSQDTLPAAATGISITPSATSWAGSSWVQLSSGIVDDILFSGISIFTAGTTAAEFEVDVGTGVSGSEVVRTTLRGMRESNTGNGFLMLPHPLEIVANTRVALRMRKGSVDTNIYKFGGMYHVKEVALPLGPASRRMMMGVGI